MTALKLPGLPFALEPAGSPPPGCRIRHGVLTLTAAAGTDLFVDPAGADPARIPMPPLVGLPPAGDFTLAAQVSVEFGSMYDAGVLLLHAAERRWAKLCFEYSPQLRPTAVTVVTRETSDDCNSFEVDGDTLWLRITRSGAAWAFHASTDGTWWRLLRYFTLSCDPADMTSGSASWPSRRPGMGARPRSTRSRSARAHPGTCATAAEPGPVAELAEAAGGHQGGQVGAEPELGRGQVVERASAVRGAMAGWPATPAGRPGRTG